jgi:hypothetical protein
MGMIHRFALTIPGRLHVCISIERVAVCESEMEREFVSGAHMGLDIEKHCVLAAGREDKARARGNGNPVGKGFHRHRAALHHRIMELYANNFGGGDPHEPRVHLPAG